MKFERIAILGAGSMGTAILAGLLRSGIDSSLISASVNTKATAEKLNDEFGITVFDRENHTDANRRAVESADVVLVAVKPAYVIETLEEVSSALKPDALVISVAAGITIDAMQGAVPASVAVIRSMPNTPAIVARAVTGLAVGSRSTDEHLAIAKQLFETVGTVLVVEENMIDELSTVSGSGPAYLFFFIEQFTKTAVEMGFSETDARLMVEETFLGASMLLAAVDKTPEQLRRQVTSPNGTTMRAIQVFENANLQELFTKATGAALARAKEIAKGN